MRVFKAHICLALDQGSSVVHWEASLDLLARRLTPWVLGTGLECVGGGF